MRPLALAGFGSFALHAALFAVVRAAPSPSPAQQVSGPVAAHQPPEMIDIEVFRAGGAATESRTAPARRRHRRPPARVLAAQHPTTTKPIPGPTGTASPTLTLTPTPLPTPLPTPALDPMAHSSALALASAMLPASPGTASLPSTAGPDLTAFFERLERAAQRCSGPRAGEGRVRFCVGPDGAPTDVMLVQSTGNFALDDAALHCVIPGAAPFPRTARCLVVPLEFH